MLMKKTTRTPDNLSKNVVGERAVWSTLKDHLLIKQGNQMKNSTPTNYAKNYTLKNNNDLLREASRLVDEQVRKCEQETRKTNIRSNHFFMGASLLNQIKSRNILPQS